MKSKVVLVDMDGVLADFDRATEERLINSFAHIPIAKRSGFYYKEDYPDPEHQKIITSIHTSQGFFASLPLVDGAIEGWQKLIDMGYEPRICSSPLTSNKWCEQEKRDWLRKYFGEQVASDAYITKDKYLCDGIVLIDGKPAIDNAETAAWRHVVFDTPYNHGAASPLRLHGWMDRNFETLFTNF